MVPVRALVAPAVTLRRADFPVPGLGRVEAVAGDAGLVALAVRDWSDAPAVRHRREPVVAGRHAHLDALRDEMRAYAAGRLRAFTVPVDLTGMPPFIAIVLRALGRVPYGATTTYGGLAAAAGRPAAARAVGTAMARNPLPIVIPCHRVCAANGIGGYTPGLAAKRQLFAIEGISGVG